MENDCPCLYVCIGNILSAEQIFELQETIWSDNLFLERIDEEILDKMFLLQNVL